MFKKTVIASSCALALFALANPAMAADWKGPNLKGETLTITCPWTGAEEQIFKKVLAMGPKVLKDAPCHEEIIEGDDVDLGQLPIQHCWPGDVAPLITWGLTITRGPNKERQDRKSVV